MTGIFARAVSAARARERAEMTPEQIAAADAQEVAQEAERAAWIADTPAREARQAAERAEGIRQRYLHTPRYDTPRGPGRPYHLAGRCTDGAERDGGRLVHVLTESSHRAVCGAEPGWRSVGWSDEYTGAATCPRCLRRATLAAPADVY